MYPLYKVKMSKPTIIAYYLPQFHPFPQNDEWWGKGFTEWTNVGKAKSLFPGHNQPRVPTELGYYDLRLPEVREQQAQMARDAGVDGFCYWHYWFGGKGRQLLNEIIDDVHRTAKPNFPFCLGWANETWKAKQWNKDGSGDKILMEQRYDGVDDYRAHFDYVRELFKDSRYIRVDGKPFFLLYKPHLFDDVENFIKLWNQWAREEGISDGIYFVASIEDQSEKEQWINKGFAAVTPLHLQRLRKDYLEKPYWMQFLIRKFYQFTKRPICYDAKVVNDYIVDEAYDSGEDVVPFLLPQWDHTPRSGARGYLVKGACPQLFQEQAERLLDLVSRKKNKLILLKSWNEWAEGNYMEPDMTHGRGFIEALKMAKK